MIIMSVVVPTHGRVALFKHTMASLYAQTAKGFFEVIVTDDSSQSHEQDEIRHIVEDYRAKGFDARYIFTKPNLYQAANTNQGFMTTSGKYIRILHSDDLLAPECIETEIKVFENNPSVDCFYHDPLLFENDIEFSKSQITDFTAGWEKFRQVRNVDILDEWLRGPIFTGTVLPSCMVFKKTLLNRIGGMKESYRFLCDWQLFYDFLIDANRHGKAMINISKGHVGWRVHSDSVTGTLFVTHYLEHLDFIKNISIAYKQMRIASRMQIRYYNQSAAQYRTKRLAVDFKNQSSESKARNRTSYYKLRLTDRYLLVHRALNVILFPFKVLSQILHFNVLLFCNPGELRSILERALYEVWKP